MVNESDTPETDERLAEDPDPEKYAHDEPDVESPKDLPLGEPDAESDEDEEWEPKNVRWSDGDQ